MSTEWHERGVNLPKTGVVEFLFPEGASMVYGGRGVIVAVDMEGIKWPATYAGEDYTHWRLHEPPKRMMTIEITEEDARGLVDFSERYHVGGPVRQRIAEACRKALKGKK